MKKVALLLGLFCAMGCEPSTRLVIQPSTHAVKVEKALRTLNLVSGCGFYPKVEIGGSNRDWKRDFPPRGSTTLQFVEPGDPRLEGKPGVAVVRENLTKCRVYIRNDLVVDRSIAHELLHCQGFEHEPGPSLMDRTASSWILPEGATCL